MIGNRPEIRRIGWQILWLTSIEIKNRKEMRMRKFVKPLLCGMMVAVLAAGC